MKAFLKLITALLIPAMLVGILFFLIYPNTSEIIIYKNSYNTEQITHNTSLRLFTSISPIAFSEGIEKAGGTADISVENISPETLAQFNNGGDIYRKVEENDTVLSVGSANIEGNVFDGEDAYTMFRGLWHFPLSVGPGDKGNFVVIAHRFDKIPPETDTFFNLDQIKVGDKIEITQSGDIEYTYTVIETKIIEKDNRSVLQPVGDHRITLITCAPLWTSDQRLVVIGVLDRVYKQG